jgi:hypothetical protein
VTIADQASTAARSYTFRADNFLARTGIAMVGYAGVERMTLNAGSAADTVGVLATQAGAPLALNLGAGDDRVSVGTAAGYSLSYISAPLTVNGEAGTDSVILNDQLNTARGIYQVTATAVDGWGGPRAGG